MTEFNSIEKEEKNCTSEQRTNSETKRFLRLTWRNWFLLAGVLVITVIGLATAIPPLLSERIVNPWPWVKTDLVLLVGLSLIVFSFVGYLTQQQKRVLKIHNQLMQLKETTEEHRRQTISRLYALLNVGRMMGSGADLQSIFDCMTNICVKTFKCHRASLMSFNKETDELVVRSVGGDSDMEILGARQKIGKGIAGWAAEHREALLLGHQDDFGKYPGLKLNDPSIISAMVVPIIVRDELVGVINITALSKDVLYNEEDLRALQVFAENAGTCIRHTEQANWLRTLVPNLQKAEQERDKQKSAQSSYKSSKRSI